MRMRLASVTLVAVLMLSVLNSCFGAPCSSYTTCSMCISSPDPCGWCTTAGSAGCEESATTTCAPADFKDPPSALLSQSTASTVINPTDVAVFLRINRPLDVVITVTPGDIPLDLVLVEDLSGSMTDDVQTLRNVAADIVTQVRARQPDTNFGIAGFIDKSMEPIAFHGDCDPDSTMDNQDCWNYPYMAWLPATPDDAQFQNSLNVLANHGNIDWPESMAEGAFHAAVCTAGSGWRPNSRHIMLISTDADTHVAGDGELLAIYKSHSRLCEDAYGGDGYGPGLGQDYPSASMVRDALVRENVVPIFAVTDNSASGTQLPNLATYQDMVDDWGFGFVYELESDSSNIIDAILTAYDTTAETVRLVVAEDERNWVQSISPSAGYDNALTNVDYPFTVRLLAGPGDQQKTSQIVLTSFGFGSVRINATTVYNCDCSLVTCPLAPGGQCNGLGVCECGLCDCAGTNFTGANCACDETLPCDPACGVHGTCRCGACECEPGYTGPTCECALTCQGSGPQGCSGHGVCECGVCNCTTGWSKADCSCTNSTCPGPSANCSGHGTCQACGGCDCFSGWTGEDCSCSSAVCPGLCSGHGACVCGECQCEPGWIDRDQFGSTQFCACNNVSCPIDPGSGLECGPGNCLCGECVCPPGLGGPTCNCSTAECPSTSGLPCSGNGTCVCGTCECAPGFGGQACQCDVNQECPTAVFGLVCSGHGVCDNLNLCACRCDAGWTHPPGGPADCSCRNDPCPSTCQPPFGECVCGTCLCNVTAVEAIPCSNPECEPFGTCVTRVTDVASCARAEFCLCDAEPTEPVVSVGNCTCAVNSCELPFCNATNALDCFETCGASCTCKDGFIGPDCNCNLNQPCDLSCANGGSCVLNTDNGACAPECRCVPPYTGAFCTDCPVSDVRCPLACGALTCGDCFADAASNDTRLQACGWCVTPSGNSTCIKNDACSAAGGTVLDACPVAPSPSPTLLENESVFYGGIAAAAILILAIIAMIIYKIFIWRRDKQLWAKFNAQQDWGLDANPLFQAAFQSNDNPIYAEDADANQPKGSTFF